MDLDETPFCYEYGKVIQLYVDGKPVVCTGNPNIFQNELLRQYLTKTGIDFRSKTIDNRLLPELKGDRYNVVGMGLYRKRNEREVKLLSNSMDYNIEIDKEHMLAIAPEFSFRLWK